jgi:hypothetical protein
MHPKLFFSSTFFLIQKFIKSELLIPTQKSTKHSPQGQESTQISDNKNQGSKNK